MLTIVVFRMMMPIERNETNSECLYRTNISNTCYLYFKNNFHVIVVVCCCRALPWQLLQQQIAYRYMLVMVVHVYHVLYNMLLNIQKSLKLYFVNAFL